MAKARMLALVGLLAGAAGIAAVVPAGAMGSAPGRAVTIDHGPTTGGAGVGPAALVHIANTDGHLEQFKHAGWVVGGGCDLLHRWQGADGNWSGWYSLGGCLKEMYISVGRNADGRLEAFAVGTDSAVYHIWQLAPNGGGGGWSGWERLGGVVKYLSAPAVGVSEDGRMDLFVVGTDGTVFRKWQNGPSGYGGWYGGWESMGGAVASRFLQVDGHGYRLSVDIEKSGTGTRWRNTQTASSCCWSGFLQLF